MDSSSIFWYISSHSYLICVSFFFNRSSIIIAEFYILLLLPNSVPILTSSLEVCVASILNCHIKYLLVSVWLDIYWAPSQCQVLCVDIRNTIGNKIQCQLKSDSHQASGCVLWGRKCRELEPSWWRLSLNGIEEDPNCPPHPSGCQPVCGDCVAGWHCTVCWLDRLSFVGGA